jgi:LmbE family N-acetylglucosaminyl deacetylase
MRSQRHPVHHRPVRRLGTVLGVWAHPDDEAYLSAGLMAIARASGRRVVVATATDGAAGGDAVSPALASLRRAELNAALAAVGVEECVTFGFADGALPDVPVRVGAHAVRQVVERVRPDTVLTFGPDGVTGHPDHQALSRWVDAALDDASVTPRLLHATLADEFHERWSALCDEVGIWMGDDRACTPIDDCSLVVRCEGDVLERKLAALHAHRSQTAGLVDLVGAATYRRWWVNEYFVDAPRSRRDDAARRLAVVR